MALSSIVYMSSFVCEIGHMRIVGNQSDEVLWWYHLADSSATCVLRLPP